MQFAKFHYQVFAEFEFTGLDLVMLLHHAEQHYDFTCKTFFAEGHTGYGWLNEFRWNNENREPRNCPEGKVRLEADLRTLNLCMKIVEQRHSVGDLSWTWKDAPRRHSVGDLIWTWKDAGRRDWDWDSGGRTHVRWNVSGYVRAVHDAHGLHYKVEHEDGVIAYYDHDEILGCVQLQEQLLEIFSKVKEEQKRLAEAVTPKFEGKLACPYCDSEEVEWQEYVLHTRQLLGVRDNTAFVDMNSEKRNFECCKEEALLCKSCFEDFPIPDGLSLKHADHSDFEAIKTEAS